MELSEIINLNPPFKVRSVHGRKRVATITGFSKNDPLGVGGGLLPDMPTAYFEDGGWCLLKDLLDNWELQGECCTEGEGEKL